MDPTVESAINYYLGLGLSKDAAVGVVSVLYAGESKLNTGSQGAQSTETGGFLNPSGAYGIASWNGPRQLELKKFATKYNLDVSALDTQLHFVLTEAANSYPQFWNAIKAGSTASYQDIISIMVNTYERPADPASEISRATNYAQSIYSLVVPPLPIPLPTPVPIPVPAPIGTITVSPSKRSIILAEVMDAVSQILQQNGVV